MVEARTDRGTRMPAAPSTSFMTCLSRNGTVWATSRPGVPIRSRRRAARYIVASHIDSTRSTFVPRSAAIVSSDGGVLVGERGDLDVAAQAATGHLGERVGRLVTDPDDPGALRPPAPG